jgi:hypothetical protein
MGNEAKAAIPQADAAMRSPGGWTSAGIGRRADHYPQPCRLANLRGPQLKRALARQF